MFFYISKILWFFLQPSTFLVILFALGFALYWSGRRTAGFRIVLAAAAIYAFIGLTPLANAMMFALERHYDRPPEAEIGQVDGIVVLGGVIDALVSVSRDEIALNEAAERLTEAAALAYRFPKARIVISGGDGALVYKSGSEALIAQEFFARIGIDPARITLETKSRTTSENAAFSKAVIDPKPGERWLLVTSAFHMARAMGCFRAVSFDVIPYPVDFRTRGREDLFRFPPQPSMAWRRFDVAVKEWLGLIVYSLTGRFETSAQTE
ncbi:MAG: YdcF family protein [Rhodomicrobium sp.]|nr:YdcF family protein [Rhodomicrobium sp.]